MRPARRIALGLALASLCGAAHAAPVDLYVSKAGKDGGPCRDAAAPCLTIAYALAQGLPIDVAGDNLVVNFQGRGAWNESVMVNGPLKGSANSRPIPNIGTVWPSMVVLNGAGAGSTTISGDPGVCYTVGASNYGVVGVRNLTLTGYAGKCQSTLFAQMGGMINVFGGNVFGAASQAQMHSENAGSSIQLWEDYTVTGGASSFMAVGGNALILQSAGTGALVGSPTFATAFVFGYANGSVQVNTSTPFRGAATGTQFILLSNASIETNGNTDVSLIPGSPLTGFVSSGGRYHGPLSANVLSATGLGAGGGASTSPGSTPLSGQVALRVGSAALSSGTANVMLPYRVGVSGGRPGFCVAAISSLGSGAWSNGASVSADLVSGPANNLRMNWSNGGGMPLASKSTFLITYHCGGD